jgi:glycosyltransferase involved in cell wall biosynthesis
MQLKKNCIPKISIIVACLNSQKTIEKTIKSIKRQKYNNLEVIIVDGGSTDNTINLIKLQNLPHVKIISETDKGIADAWNKGLRLSRGDIIGILNSDDYYKENIFKEISVFFHNRHKPIIAFGDVILFKSKDKSKKIIKGKIRSKLGLLNGFGFLHPSVFFNRKALEKIGFFDTKIRIASDVDWLLRAVSLGIKFKKIPSVTYMLSGGLSSLYPFTAAGEYADSLTRNGYSKFYILIFFMLRFFGRVKVLFK